MSEKNEYEKVRQMYRDLGDNERIIFQSILDMTILLMQCIQKQKRVTVNEKN